MVVNDFDLKSTAKLAESSLLSSNNIRNQMNRSGDPLLKKSVDLCIAINTASIASTGLYVCGDELLPYYQGPTRRIRMLKTTSTATSAVITSRDNIRKRNPYTYNGTEVGDLRGRPRIGKKMLSSSFRSIPVPVPLPPASQPIFFMNDDTSDFNKDNGGFTEVEENNDTLHFDSLQHSIGISLEERAARRGLITAALSQLESIVCRVAYMLKNDRDDEKKSPHAHLRLTSNSLNIRNRWLPLVEGLGVTGLVEEEEQPSVKQQSSSFSASASASDAHSDDSECDSSGDSSSTIPSEREQHRQTIGNAAVVSPTESKGKEKESCNYSCMIEELLRSAHPLQTSDKDRDGCSIDGEHPFPQDRKGPLFQSIVVTVATTANNASAKSEMKLGSTEELKKDEPSTSPLHTRKSENHNLKNIFVRDHLLLKIDVGVEAPPSSQPSLLNGNTTTTVIVPGSLRTRGEFCLVDLILDDEIETEGTIDDSTSDYIDSGKLQRPSRWRVEQTHFHRLESQKNTRDWV